jgi:hypothetical protein
LVRDAYGCLHPVRDIQTAMESHRTASRGISLIFVLSQKGRRFVPGKEKTRPFDFIFSHIEIAEIAHFRCRLPGRFSSEIVVDECYGP